LEHLISLVNNHVLETLQSQNFRAINEVHETTRGANDNITTLLELLDLLADRATSIDDARAKHRAVTKAPSLVKDLGRKLTARADNENEGLGSNARSDAFLIGDRIGTRSSELLGLTHELRNDGHQECSSLAGAYTLYKSVY
jgi:hypothetical protein